VREQALTLGGMATAAVQMRRGAAVARSLAWMRGERGNKGGSRRIQSGRKDAEENVMGRAPMAF
jgi:hypothetical protein